MKKLLTTILLLSISILIYSQTYKNIKVDSISTRSPGDTLKISPDTRIYGDVLIGDGIIDTDYNTITSPFGAAYVVLNTSYGDISESFIGDEQLILNGGSCDGEVTTAIAVYYDRTEEVTYFHASPSPSCQDFTSVTVGSGNGDGNIKADGNIEGDTAKFNVYEGISGGGDSSYFNLDGTKIVTKSEITELKSQGIFSTGSMFNLSGRIDFTSATGNTGFLSISNDGYFNILNFQRLHVGSDAHFLGDIYIQDALGIGTSNPSYPLDVVGDVYIAGQVLFDPAWEDLRFPYTLSVRGNKEFPHWDDIEKGLLFPDDQDTTGLNKEVADHIVQLTHDIDTTMHILYPHLHWWQESADTIAFRCRHRITSLGEEIGTWIYGKTIDAAYFPYVSGTIHQILSFEPIILPNGYKESTIIDVEIYRIDDGGVGAVTGDVLIKEFDIQYPKGKMGTTWH